MKMMEAVALFDYNGRTNKELSFKKNQIIFIYKKINHQWWFGYILDRNQSGFIPDSYIKFKSRRRDSAPVQHLPLFSITPNSSSSLHSINLPILSNIPISISLNSNIDQQSKSSKDIEIYANLNPYNYDVLPSTPPSPISTNDQHTTECYTQQENDAPDLVLNLPISNGFLTPSTSICHSTIIIDLSEQKQIPPSIMKKSEKTLQQTIESSSIHFNITHRSQPIFSISESSKTTEV